jgi:hypothetical protein
LSYWRRLTGACLRPRYGVQESLGVRNELGVRKEQEWIFHRYDRENDGGRRCSQNTCLEDSRRDHRSVPDCSGIRLPGVFSLIGEKERQAVFRSHLVTPPLVVLVDQYPAIEVEKAAITGMIAEKS